MISSKLCHILRMKPRSAESNALVWDSLNQYLCILVSYFEELVDKWSGPGLEDGLLKDMQWLEIDLRTVLAE